MMKEAKMSTKSIWAGEKEQLAFGATQVPVVHSVSFGYDDMDEWYDVAVGAKPAIFMAGTPTRRFRPLKIKSAFWKEQRQPQAFLQAWRRSVIR